jgi:Fic family protein
MAQYIHQLPGWPNFRWRDHELLEPLAQTRNRQGRLLGRMESLGFKLRDEATLRLLTIEAVKTSEIEGEILNEEQVRSSIARHMGLEHAALSSVDRSVDGIVEVILDATSNYDQPVTAERLFGWHAALFSKGWSGIRRITPGAWRTTSVEVISGSPGKERVHFEGPPADQIAGDMQAFLRWLNEMHDIDPVLKAAIAHFWFVTIHPFEDGNGRIARALADLLLARSEGTSQRFYSMSAQIRAERNKYYDCLEETQKGDLDLTAHLLWFLKCMERSLAQADETLADVLGKARFWETFRTVEINERQRLVINRILDGFEGKLTSSKWAKLAKTSQPTAGRDIDDLEAKGILRKDAAGGRSTSYSLVIPD